MGQNGWAHELRPGNFEELIERKCLISHRGRFLFSEDFCILMNTSLNKINKNISKQTPLILSKSTLGFPGVSSD